MDFETKSFTIKKIQAARIEKNLSQEDLGHLIGRSSQYIECFELGIQKFGILNVLKFCEVLHLDPVEFYADFN